MRAVSLISVLLLASASAEEQVVFETSFDELPIGWNSHNWTFESGRASLSLTAYNNEWGLGILDSGGPLYPLPEGTDSLAIHISHYVNIYGDWAYVEFTVWTNTMGILHGFAHLVDDASWTSSDPIHCVITDPPDGTIVGFEFWGEVEAGSYTMSNLYWALYDMTVTAYGVNLSFRESTWGRIKTLM